MIKLERTAQACDRLLRSNDVTDYRPHSYFNELPPDPCFDIVTIAWTRPQTSTSSDVLTVKKGTTTNLGRTALKRQESRELT